MSDPIALDEYPKLDYLLACQNWTGAESCTDRGLDQPDWCDECVALYVELPALVAAVRAAERERIAKLIDENADVYLKKTQETGDDVCAVYAVLQSRLAAKIRAMGDEDKAP